MKKLWTEKYRPKNISEYVFKDESQKKQVESWISEETIPTMMLSGSPGTGKTSMAKLLVNELEIDDYDFMEINASLSNSVDDVKTKIINFVSTMPFGKFKVILCDEFDAMSVNAQWALRNLMETYSDTARFILTCNYRNKIIPALQSRCQGFHIEKLDKVEFTTRLAEILIAENIKFDIDILDSYVKAGYPDLRKCLNLLQQNSIDNVLNNFMDESISNNTDDYMVRAVELFKKRKFREGRELICRNIGSDEIDDIWTWMYQNLELWGETNEQKDKAILVIRKGLINHTLVSDPEINLSATIIELGDI